MPDNGERFATKEEILKRLKKDLNNRKLTYKEYMVEVKRTEKYYDIWKQAYDEMKSGKVLENPEIDTTNEELAVGKKMSELQTKEKPVDVNETLEEETEKDAV